MNSCQQPEDIIDTTSQVNNKLRIHPFRKQTDPTHYILKVLKAGVVHPDVEVSLPLLVLFWINCTLFCGVFILAGTGTVVGTINNDINQVVESLQNAILYIHCLGKYMVLFYNKPILSKLLKERSKFSTFEDFGSDVHKEYEQILVKASRFINIFLCLVFSLMCTFYMQPFLTGGDLPASVYVPEGWYYFITVGLWILAPAIAASIYGSDTMFCAICVPVIIQFKLLGHKIKAWKWEKTQIRDRKEFKKNLKELVDHQNFLFEYCNKISKFFNAIFINQFLLSVGIICMQLFVVSQSGFKLPNKIKCVGYSFMNIVETAIYCFNAELISDASEEVGNAAYSSLWYKSDDSDVSKVISLIIARCQNRIVFSGFGLVWINLQTFTQIFKTALSFYSYLHNLVIN